MSVYANTSSINASGSWNLIDATSYNNTETTTSALTTSYQISSSFTPGAITISHIGVKLSVRTGTTGTITVCLDQAGSDVSGTTVTINTADLPVAATADLNGGWIFFKLSSPVTLSAATAYGVKARTSSSSQVSLFSTATTNWARALITTATATPGAGDDMIVTGEYTGAGTSNVYTVTWNITATTDYGAASTSLVLPALAICSKGTLTFGTTAATNYNMKMSGNVIVYSGGTMNIGTTGTPIPRDSSAKLQFDCGTNVDFGLTVRNLGTFVAQGLSRTSGKLIDRCFLNTDEAINSTSLGVDTDTGWLDNDIIAVASTTRTATQCEQGTLNGNAGASSLTVDGFAGAGGGIAFAHDGIAPIAAEVILLTRNVSIFGVSTTLQSYVDIKATAAIDWDWVEFYWMGSATTLKRGIDLATTTGVATINNCSFHNFAVASSRGLNVTGSTGTGLSIVDCVLYNVSNENVINTTTSGSSVFNNIIAMKNIINSVLFTFADAGGTVSNIYAIGSIGTGISFSDSGTWNTVSNINAHSNTGDGVSLQNGIDQYINGTSSWRNTTNGYGISPSQTNQITINNLVAFGNNPQNIRITSGLIILYSPILNGDSTFSTTNGISNQGNGGGVEIRIFSGNLGTASGIKTAHTNDINFQNSNVIKCYLNNTILASATEVTNQTFLPPTTSFISSQKHDQTKGLHKTWKRYGTISISTAVVRSGTTSMQLAPLNATSKLESIGALGGFKIAVADGTTCTPTVYVYEDATYNGNRARLVLKRNDAMGITSDTVLATATSASDLAWEALSGTTPTVTDNGTLEFVIDCDGTAGNIYIDSFTAA